MVPNAGEMAGHTHIRAISGGGSSRAVTGMFLSSLVNCGFQVSCLCSWSTAFIQNIVKCTIFDINDMEVYISFQLISPSCIDTHFGHLNNIKCFSHWSLVKKYKVGLQVHKSNDPCGITES